MSFESCLAGSRARNLHRRLWVENGPSTWPPLGRLLTPRQTFPLNFEATIYLEEKLNDGLFSAYRT